MAWVQLLEGAAAQQLGPFPCAPERDPGLAQRSEVQRMHAFGRRVQREVSQVLPQQPCDLGTAQIIDADFHLALEVLVGLHDRYIT